MDRCMDGQTGLTQNTLENVVRDFCREKHYIFLLKCILYITGKSNNRQKLKVY